MPKKKLIAAEDLYELQFVEDPQLSPDGKHIAFVKMSLDKLTNKYKRSIWLTDLSTATPTTRQFTFGSKPDTSPRWSP
ncbi:MAG: S9 family peptidase, partial [Chloroflexota bacterium]